MAEKKHTLGEHFSFEERLRRAGIPEDKIKKVAFTGKKKMAKKKVVKPTPEEQKTINKRLLKKYPHMGEQSWADKLKGKVKKELKSRKDKTTSGLKTAGLTDAEIKRLKGKK